MSKSKPKTHVIGVRVEEEKQKEVEKYKIDTVALFRAALDHEIKKRKLHAGMCPECGQKVRSK